MKRKIKVGVIDDHPLFREGVTRSLSELEDFEVVAEGGSRDDAVRIARQFQPDILLIDLSMPGGGLDAIRTIIADGLGAKIVVLTVSETGDHLAAALNGGVRGYVLKGIGSRALAEVLQAVAAGETYVTPSLSARLLSQLSDHASSAIAVSPMHSLSPREREVLGLVAEGLSNKQIALRLDVHEKTVKHHVSSLLGKLQASNRTEAAMKYRDSVSG